jgi:hypothetical protein
LADKDKGIDTFIAEVDEEVRRDQMQALWRRYRYLGIGAVVVLLLGVGGYEGWKRYQAEKNESAGRAFIAAQMQAQDGRAAEAAQAFGALARGGHAGYGQLAAFQQAGQLLRAKDIAGAVAAFDAIAGNSEMPPELRDLARYYAALNGMDILPPEEAKRRLEAVAPASPWSGAARELLALVELKAGDRMAARKRLAELADDGNAPLGVRGRATELLAALGGPVQ